LKRSKREARGLITEVITKNAKKQKRGRGLRENKTKERKQPQDTGIKRVFSKGAKRKGQKKRSLK